MEPHVNQSADLLVAGSDRELTSLRFHTPGGIFLEELETTVLEGT